MKAQRGNILFLILLAVILFAALSYAVTSSMRGGGNNASTENAQVRAASVMQWLTMLENTVGRMKLVGGIPDNQLNFYYSAPYFAISGSNDNPNCTESRCRVFDPAGGGMTKLDNTVYKKTGANADVPYLLYRQMADIGTTASDVMVELYGVDWDVCQAINKANNVAAMPYGLDPAPGNVGLPVSAPYMSWGSFPVGDIPATTPWSGSGQLIQSKTFCYCRNPTKDTCMANTSEPRVVHILIAR